MIDLKGKTAVVTGVNRGIGLAIADVLSRCGADIIGFSSKHLDQAQEIVEFNGKNFTGYAVDFKQEDQLKSTLEELCKKTPVIDILVNNAGITAIGPTLEMSDDAYKDTIAINMRAPYLLCQYLSSGMIKRRRGKIINIASIHSFIGSYEVSAYVATKHAIVGMTKAFANEWGEYNIQVNAVAPGFTKTDNTRGLQENKKMMEKIEEEIPLKRWASPEEIAWPVAFLASDLSSYINGHTLIVDGGYINR